MGVATRQSTPIGHVVVPGTTQSSTPIAAPVSDPGAKNGGVSGPKVAPKRLPWDRSTAPQQPAQAAPSSLPRAIPSKPAPSMAKPIVPTTPSNSASRGHTSTELQRQQQYHNFQQQRQELRREARVQAAEKRRERPTVVQPPPPSAVPSSPAPVTPREGTRRASAVACRPVYGERRAGQAERRAGVAHGVSHRRRVLPAAATQERNEGGSAASPSDGREVVGPTRERKGSIHGVSARRSEDKVARSDRRRVRPGVEAATRLTSGGVTYVSSCRCALAGASTTLSNGTL